MPIKKLREAQGLKQYELAELMGVKSSSVSAWENGLTLPSGENIMKLARLLHCSCDAVLGYQTEESA